MLPVAGASCKSEGFRWQLHRERVTTNIVLRTLSIDFPRDHGPDRPIARIALSAAATASAQAPRNDAGILPTTRLA